MQRLEYDSCKRTLQKISPYIDRLVVGSIKRCLDNNGTGCHPCSKFP